MTETASIPVDPKRPVTIGNTAVVSFFIKPQMFVDYLSLIEAARKVEGDFATAMWREWTVRNVVPQDAGGAPVKFGITDVMQFPASYASKFRRYQEEDSSTKGKIVKDGDGIDAPCVYELGTPLPLGTDGASGDDAGSIIELEFLVRTIGDVEPVLMANGTFDQADALIRNCAKPLSRDDCTLMRLPDAALAQLTVADGMEIATKVLPRFFV